MFMTNAVGACVSSWCKTFAAFPPAEGSRLKGIVSSRVESSRGGGGGVGLVRIGWDGIGFLVTGPHADVGAIVALLLLLAL